MADLRKLHGVKVKEIRDLEIKPIEDKKVHIEKMNELLKEEQALS